MGVLIRDIVKIPKGPARVFIITGAVIILVIVFMAVFAPLIAPYSPVKSVGDVFCE
jgi:peptide/nickel transport system permease protein